MIYTIGIDDLENTISFNIYPNPSKGTLFVAIRTEESKNLEVKFVNQLGMIVMSSAVSVSNSDKLEFDLEQFAQGVYYISITGDKLNYVRKIIVQK